WSRSVSGSGTRPTPQRRKGPVVSPDPKPVYVPPSPAVPPWAEAARAARQHFAAAGLDRMPPVVLAQGGTVLAVGSPPLMAYHERRGDPAYAFEAALILRFGLQPRVIVYAFDCFDRAVSGDPAEALAGYPGDNAERFAAGDPAVTRSVLALRAEGPDRLDLFSMPYTVTQTFGVAWDGSAAAPTGGSLGDVFDRARAVMREPGPARRPPGKG